MKTNLKMHYTQVSFTWIKEIKYDKEELQSLLNPVTIIKSCFIEETVFYIV